MSKTEPTFGEKFVGVSFNPSGNDSVNKIKEAAAAYADVLATETAKLPDQSFESTLMDEALKNTLLSQMLAVKAVTWEQK